MKKIALTIILPLLAIFLFSAFNLGEEDKTIQTGHNVRENLAVGEAEYVFRLGKVNKTRVSSLLMGFNVIYPHEKDVIWQDGKIASFLKDVNAGFIRYPGGTVCSYYHWDDLTGEGWADSWDPEKPVTPKPGSEFMDIDEYMALVKTSGATPLVGINMSSGWRWDRQQDGLNEAVALMKYCRDKHFNVKYWYLDNEPYQHDSNGGSKTPEEYAALINAYVPVMKAFDPDIKIVANWNAGFRNKHGEYERLLRLAGDNIDIIDVHWYWSWNDTSWEKWLEKTPLVQWTGFTYESEILHFRQMVKMLGYPHIELASFEWNTGPIRVGNSLTAPRAAFVHAEMMMQYISGGLDYAVFWPIHWPDKASRKRSFVNTATGSANPVYHIFKFMGKMLDGLLVETQEIENGNDMVSIAVLDPNEKKLRICVINKKDKAMVTGIDMDQFPGMKLEEAQKYTVDTDGNEYSLDKTALLKSENPDTAKFMAEGISITMLTFGI